MAIDKILLNASKNNTVDETSSTIRSGVNVDKNNTNKKSDSTTTSNDSDYSSSVKTEVYSDAPPGTIEYYAKEGETLESIANDNDISVDYLKTLNPDLMNDDISENDRLFIPEPKKSNNNNSSGGSNNDSNNSSNSGSNNGSGSSSGNNTSGNDNSNEEEQSNNKKTT